MIPRIRLLSPTLAERIAAGEVIERPASVVKELIENSIDAEASEIAVVLEQGGKELIEVLDNGNGMLPEDLQLCIERHATSKLTSLEDLDRIFTLGFRGEALSSIAAVTDLQVVSRAKDSQSAYEVLAGDIAGRWTKKPQAMKVTFGHFINAPHGTRIQARGLFSQIPARLKFLKSQGSEVAQIREWIERLAIAHPHIGFSLISEDRTILRLQPSDEATRVRTLLCDGGDYPLMTAANERDGMRDTGLAIRIHWLQGLSTPQSRKIIQIVNGRAVRDRLLQQAILAPFRQLLLPGQFPTVALLVDVNPAAIDVNVHPTKTEIRFLDSRKIFSTVETLIKSMIVQEGAPAVAPPSFPQWDRTPLTDWRPSSLSAAEMSPTLLTSPSIPISTQSSIKSHPLASARYLGTLFQTYLVYEGYSDSSSHHSNVLTLVDQHAAHERVRYEKLRKRILGTSSTTPSSLLTSQALLLPEVIRFPKEYHTLVIERLSWIFRFGFEAEIFGEDSLVFRSVPIEWGTQGLNIRLKNLIDRILSYEGPSGTSDLLMDEALFERLANEACHSAIRAGDSLQEIESKELVRQLFECEHPWNCPHGRPTIVKVPQGKLEEWFQRKV